MTQQVVRVGVAVVSAFGLGEHGTRPVACPPVLDVNAASLGCAGRGTMGRGAF